MGRSVTNSSKSIPTPPPPPPPPPPSSFSSGGGGVDNNTWRSGPSLSSVGISPVSLRPNRPPTQVRNNLPTGGPFRLPPAPSVVSKKIRPPLPPPSSSSPSSSFSSPSPSSISSQSSQSSGSFLHHHHHPAPPPPSSFSIRSASPSTGYSNVSTPKPMQTTYQVRNSVPNSSPSVPFRIAPAVTLPRKVRPPLPPPPPPAIPPSGFSNNSSKFPPPPSLASSNSLRKPAIPPKKNFQNDSISRSFNSLPPNLESRFRHIFKDLHTLPAPEPFLSTRKQYPSERKPRGPAPPIPSRSTSITSANHNYYNDATRFNSTPMIHVQLEHQALGVNYPRY